jgi:hypothetical protein
VHTLSSHARACGYRTCLLASWLGAVSAAKPYYILFANAAAHVYRMGTIDASSLERGTCSTSWSLRVSQARALQRVIMLRNYPPLLSELMANLKKGNPTYVPVCSIHHPSALNR